jgi:hypothetical protein
MLAAVQFSSESFILPSPSLHCKNLNIKQYKTVVLPVVLCRYEAKFQKKLLNIIYESKIEDITEE